MSREHRNDNKIEAGKQVPRSSEYPAAVRDPGPVKTSHFSAPLRSVKGANMASLTHSASSWGEQWGNSALMQLMCLSSGSQGPQPTHFHMRVTLAGRSFPCYSSRVGTVGAEEEAPDSSGAQLSPSAFFTWRFGEAGLNHLDLLFGCCLCSLPLLSCIAQPRACMETPTPTGPMASA